MAKTLSLRAEKARLLGYDSYAALKLDDTMAKTPAAVFGLLDPVWDRAREKAGEDQAAMQRLAAEAGDNHPIAGWDWRYYQEKLRAQKFAFDEAELKPYLQLERIIAACFDVATRLFGISFEAARRRRRLASGRARVRGAQCRRNASRHFRRRLFRTRHRSGRAPG